MPLGMHKIRTSSDITVVLFIVQCLEGGEAKDNSITQVSLKILSEEIDKKLPGCRKSPKSIIQLQKGVKSKDVYKKPSE